MAFLEINLLAQDKQKKTTRLAFLPQIKTFVPLLIGIVVLIVAVHLVLIAAVLWNKGAYSNLSKKWKSIEGQKNEWEKLKNEASRMEKKISLVEQLLSGRFIWSDTMESINESIVSGIWLNSFLLGEKTPPNTSSKRAFMSLSGSVVTSGGQGTATIGKFMNNLKENKEFSNDFDEIELGSIQRKSIKETEIMDFTITAYFKKDKVIF